MTKTTDEYLTEFVKGDQNDPANKHYHYNDRFRFGFTFRHIGNSILSIPELFTGTALDHCRASLTRTVSGCSEDEIRFLRRDRSVGLATLAKRADRLPAERVEIMKHIAWLKGDYTTMLARRMDELKAKKQ